MFRRQRSEDDFAAEIAAHIELEAERLRDAGMSSEAAADAARRAFGNVTAAQERFYESRRVLFCDRLTQDVRFSFRVLARTPVLTAAIVATLALGIGVSSAVFSLVHAVVLRPLPFERPRELVQLYETGPRQGGEADWVSFPNFRDWRAGTRVFRGMAAYHYAVVTLTGDGGADSVLGLEVTDRLFRVLGVSPALGRTFLPGEDRPARDTVAVIGHALWERRFGADPRVVGRHVTIDGRSYTIVGVMPRWFRFPMSIPGDTFAPIDLWIPMRAQPDLEERGSHNFWVVARLAPDVTLDRARAAMLAIADNLARQYPQTNKDFDVAVVPLQDYVAGRVRPALLMLLGAVGLVLLLMCANIANLLLARAETRRREMAVRRAVGASGGRLLRQTLTESLLLAGGGALAGWIIARAGTRLLVRLGPPGIPRLDQTSVDATVLVFLAGASASAGVLFGLAPAFVGARETVQHALKDAGARVAGAAGRRLRRLLVATQLALAVMLLVGAGLLVRSFIKVAGLDLGFRVKHVMAALVNLSPARYSDSARQVAFFDEAVRRIQELPGVVSAGVSNSIPLTGINDQGGFAIEGRPDPRPGEDHPHANRPKVSAGYFETMGIRLLEGRLFDARDRAGALPVAIVSDLAARTYWPGTSPIGRRLATEWIDGRPAWRQIVGIVQSTRHFGLEAPQKPEIYIPHQQAPTPFMELVVRTTADASDIVPNVRRVIAAIDPEQAIAFQTTMEDLLDGAEARRRFQMALVTGFALLALALAAIGVYGVMSHMVALRTREIGVRLALGARPRDVIGMVLASGTRLTIAGAAVGLAGAAALSRVVAGLLFGVSPFDPGTYAAVAAALVMVATVAAYLPSRAAARVDPLLTLRDE